MLDELRVYYCALCAAESAFSRPGCDDGHGVDCPEWACIECGSAILVGVLVEVREASQERPAA
jgi:hypothetical protein